MRIFREGESQREAKGVSGCIVALLGGGAALVFYGAANMDSLDVGKRSFLLWPAIGIVAALTGIFSVWLRERRAFWFGALVGFGLLGLLFGICVARGGP